uniref:Uncharacterized protein n=1 Tax=Anguilla anguilla TaxID=7936 RepID=A0A0E9W633_ANGAN
MCTYLFFFLVNTAFRHNLNHNVTPLTHTKIAIDTVNKQKVQKSLNSLKTKYYTYIFKAHYIKQTFS